MVPFAIVTALVAVTVAAALAIRFGRQGSLVFVFDEEPDAPVAFGRDMSWLAVKTEDADHLVASLGLLDAEPANWRTGTSAIYEPSLRATRVFVSPPVNGWTLVAGLSLPHPVHARFVDKCRPLLETLSARYGDVHYFANDSIVDLHAWVRASGGRLVRGYAVIDGDVVLNTGRTDRDERGLGIAHFDIRGVADRSGDIGGGLMMSPTAEHVLKLAGRWSVDPTTLPSRYGHAIGTGRIAHAPATWRVERNRSATAKAA